MVFRKKMRLILTSMCALYTCLLNASFENDSFEENKLRENISYHLLIHNYTQAARVAQDAVGKMPDSKNLRRLHMETLSHLGDEKKLLRAWQQYARDFPAEKYEDGLLEWVAKGVLRKAEISDPYSSKMYRYAVADSFTDASSVEVLTEALQDSNFMVRDMALNAALVHGDEVILEGIEELLSCEKIPAIKFKAMQVLMRIKGEAANDLADHMILDPKISANERQQLMFLRLNCQKEIHRNELKKLSKSSNMIERYIAGYAFGYFHHVKDLDLLYELLSDPISDVRLQAITSLGLLRLQEIENQNVVDLMRPVIEGDHPQLALVASWVSMLSKDQMAKEHFRDFMYHSNPKIRLEAASLICYSMPYTLNLAQEFFQTHQDPFVRLNLSAQLLVHRQNIQDATNEIVQFLSQPLSAQFKTSMPYPMEMIWPMSLIDDYEKAANPLPSISQTELVHFCLLNLLSIVEDPRASELISVFLETHHSSIALSSMPQFIRAGSAPLVELIRSFFNHPDLMKRIHAAAIVAILKKDEKALDILYQAYPQVDRHLKEMILNITGQIKSKDSIPFLVDALYEPSQSLRIVASSALMQCLRN